ncbi:MAG TPA: hypothetical protein VFS39_08450 [Nitrospira sp.]|nr:hypothetical protein [Nitrospira sp.]
MTRILLIVAFLLAGCVTRPEVDVTLHESERGKVRLERIPDRSFQAAHPISLPGETVARVLGGILVRQDQSVFQNLISGKPEAVRALSEEEVLFLSPWITEALSRAASDQQVGFTIHQIGAPGYSTRVGAAVGSSEPPLQLAPKETTSGVLYAYGRSLYVTLTEYRHRTERPDTVNMPNRHLPDPTGLINHTVLFAPELAKRSDSYRDSQSTDSTLVIDYELLANLPVSDGAPTAAPLSGPANGSAQPDSGASVQKGGSQKDPEIEALRKELDDIKKQLAEQNGQRKQAKPKQPTGPKSP